MAANLKTLARLAKAYAKMDLLLFLRDTKTCLLWVLTDCVTSLSNVAGMYLLASRLAKHAGFEHASLLLTLGCSLLVNGIYSLFFTNNNAGAISRVIGRGQLDHALVQPVPLPAHFLAQGIAPFSGTGPLLCGIGLTAYALCLRPAGLHPLWWVLLPLVLLLSCGILLAWVYGISALAFWAPYAGEEIAPEVSGLFFSLSPYPLGAFSQLAQITLCSVLPVGAMAWLPTRILLGQQTFGLCFLAVVCAASVSITILIFRKGLQYYAKTSSPRYTGFGR